MTIIANVQKLFNPAAVALAFQHLPGLKSSFIDELFPGRVDHPSAVIGLMELETVLGTMPLVSRRGGPTPMPQSGESGQMWSVRPIKPSLRISAADLNDQQFLWGSKISRDQYVAAKIDDLRQIVRNTTEAIASVVATTGKVVWPSRTETGALETFTMDLGTVAQKNPPVKWDAASDPPELEDVYEYFSDLDQSVAEAGGGGDLKFFAGKNAFKALLKLARLWQSTAKGDAISLKLESGAINIGGYEVRRMTERYQSPLDGQWLPKLDDNKILGYSKANSGKVFYLAVDSISANNQAKSFHVVVKENEDDSAINLIAQAKPLPVRDARSLISGLVCD